MAYTNSSQDKTAQAPWYTAYPAPRNIQPATITREEVLEMMQTDGYTAGREFVLVDLRRNDHEGGTIRGSINLPAQSLYSSIPALYNILKPAGVRKVIWYCNSSNGRGPRAAGWFHDHLADQGDNEMQSLVLVGGMKGWATAGGQYVQLMDGFNGAAWISK